MNASSGTQVVKEIKEEMKTIVKRLAFNHVDPSNSAELMIHKRQIKKMKSARTSNSGYLTKEEKKRARRDLKELRKEVRDRCAFLFVQLLITHSLTPSLPPSTEERTKSFPQ